MIDKLEQFRSSLNQTGEKIAQLSSLLAQAEKSRADEIADQLNGAKHVHTELENQLDALERPSEGDFEGLCTAYEAASKKLDDLVNSIKMKLDSDD